MEKGLKIALYPGSFNPLHNGHLQLAQYILRGGRFAEVWMLVSPNNPLKRGQDLADEQLRFRWLTLALQDYPQLRACDFEFSLPRPSYTINTLHALRLAYPQHRFTLLMGADNLAVLERWKDYETILSEFEVLVYPRQGVNLEPLLQRYSSVQALPDAPLFPISSTQIRQLIQAGKPINAFVPKVIVSEIERYYRNF